MNNVICIIALILMFLVLLNTVLRLTLSKREERLEYIKKYRKGQAVIIYIISLPLIFIALYDNYQNFANSFFKSIKLTVEIIVLKFPIDDVNGLVSTNDLFKVTIYTCFIMIIFNVLMFSVSLFGRRIYNFSKCLFTERSKEMYIVIGYNETNLKMIQTKKHVIVLANVNVEEKDKLYIAGCAYRKFIGDDYLEHYLKKLKNISNRFINVIINTSKDAINIGLTKQVCNFINENNLSNFSINKRKGLYCYTFGDTGNASIFNHFVEQSNGCIKYVDYHQIIAFDFEERFPFTNFMTSDQIDYEHASIKSDVKLNVFMIGFGKINKQIFLTSIANNQFNEYNDGKYSHKRVNYYLYDKNEAQNDRNLNHNLFRYETEMSKVTLQEEKLPLDKKEYFPLIGNVANIDPNIIKIDDVKFYDSLKSKMTDNSYNYMIIALGDDLVNIDLAEKIVAKIKEWKMNSNTKIFVRIKDDYLSNRVVESEYQDLIPFGQMDVVYDIDKIVNEKIDVMARRRHLAYTKIKNAGKSEEEIWKIAYEKWFGEWNQAKRDSNTFCCLSIRMKLQLMGFDYVEGSNGGHNDDFLARYTYNDPITYNEKGKIVYTNENLLKDSIRGSLARQEHLRWNSYMVCGGFIPASKMELKNALDSNTKKEMENIMRKHANITTMEGLIEYRKLVSSITGESEEETDVIRFDYELMDELLWILDECDYKIVKK